MQIKFNICQKNNVNFQGFIPRKVAPKNIGAALDMDGVIIDSVPFHKIAWQVFCERHGKNFTQQDMMNISGRSNPDALRYIFGDGLTAEQVENYALAKEMTYQEVIAPHLKPIKGFMDFMTQLDNAKVKHAVASSAPPINIEMLTKKMPYLNGFPIINATMVEKSKPHPDIFLKAAQAMGVEPEKCVVFEDANSGFEAARRANMKVVGVATTIPVEELVNKVDFVIKDFTQIDLPKFLSILA